MNIAMSRLAPLFLLLWLLPACAELPWFPPPGESVETGQGGRSFSLSECRGQLSQPALHGYAWRLLPLPTWSAFPRDAMSPRLACGKPRLLGLQGNWQGSSRLYQSILNRQPEPPP